MSRRVYARVERTIIVVMLLGMVGMFQPFALDVYRYGFLSLLFSTIAFIIISHLSPKPERTDAPVITSPEQARDTTYDERA
ncbi:MAG: hypothetical protein ACJ8CR_38370 [Roseiflexaceae bacterium]